MHRFIFWKLRYRKRITHTTGCLKPSAISYSSLPDAIILPYIMLKWLQMQKHYEHLYNDGFYNEGNYLVITTKTSFRWADKYFSKLCTLITFWVGWFKGYYDTKSLFSSQWWKVIPPSTYPMDNHLQESYSQGSSHRMPSYICHSCHRWLPISM